MQRLNGRLTFSATDLNNFLACEHLTSLDLDVLREGGVRPTERSKQAEILSRLGEEHEAVYLDKLRAQGLKVVTIERGADPADAAGRTEAAMSQGADVIYQATFFHDGWLGHADFLRRVDGASRGGRWLWHYEVEDTKLARHTEPYFLLQLCNYSEHVARVQGVWPERMYVVLGDGSRQDFRVNDFAAYYRSVKARFLARLDAAGTPSYPYPNKHCDLCVWDAQCTARRRDDDHLSLVANITRVQTHRLNANGIARLAELGAADSTSRPRRMAEDTFATLVRQARLQFEQREALRRGDSDPYKYEILPFSSDPADPARGFGLLPAPSPGDVFFDMEGDPYYDIGEGLEYLFGAYTHVDGAFTAFWGCDRSDAPGNDRLAEKRAFEAFVDFIMERRERFPDMHVYHYASYEKSALCRLAQRHATREAEVDRMLREELLVDLYRVVRQAVAVGQPSYSIKKLEDYYGNRAETAVKAGDESILQFEEWLATRTRRDTRDDAILRNLETYNRFDCESTYGLREWLLRLRDDAIAQTGADIPPFIGTPPPEAKPDNDTFAELKARLQARIPEDFDPANADAGGDGVRHAFMLRHMLEYHWREDKPLWWQFHDRCAAYSTDRTDMLDDAECIVGLEPAGPPEPDKRSMIYPLRYPMQLHKIGLDDVFDLVSKKKAGEIVGITESTEHGILRLRRGPTLADEPLPQAITICKTVNAGVVRDGIARFAESVLDGTAAERYPAMFDVFTAAAPRLGDRPRGSVIQPERTDEASVRAVTEALDRSYLFIQGPPGSGKTYIGARLIAELVRAGRKVGVMANSHKAIHNLLDAFCDVARERGIAYTGIKKCSKGDNETVYDGDCFRSIDGPLAETDATVLAGTAWAFAAQGMDQRLDYLFIDEAGQVALPAALGAMTCARNVVFLGDPLQLAQVSHAQHPGDIGVSVLEHLLQGELRPVLPDRGIFLTDSYRMHPAVCTFISDVMYDGRLQAAPGRDRQRVDGPGLRGTGLRFVPVDHSFNKQRSVEEAGVVADEIERLLRGTVTTVDAVQRPFTARDVIVVTPYNAQVACIRRELDGRGLGDVAVGTVDKFQGREAYVVFFSTAASSPEEASRGVSFIFDRQRFNVAISRARALAVWVGSPALLPQRCSSVEDVRVANGVCRFLELAEIVERTPAPA